MQRGSRGAAQQGDHELGAPVVGRHRIGVRNCGGAKAGRQIRGQGGAVAGDRQHPVVTGRRQPAGMPASGHLESACASPGKLPVAGLAAVGD